MPSFFLPTLFESPGPLVAALAMGGAFAWFAVRERPAGWLALPAALVLLAAGSVALARAVATDREAAEAAVRAMVDAAAPFDSAVFDAALTPDAELLGPAGDSWLRIAEIRDRVAEYAGRSGGVEHVVKTLDVDPISEGAGGAASTLALLRVTSRGGPGPGGSGLPTTTDWELDLRRAAGGPWRVRSFRWLKLNLQPPPDAGAWR